MFCDFVQRAMHPGSFAAMIFQGASCPQVLKKHGLIPSNNACVFCRPGLQVDGPYYLCVAPSKKNMKFHMHLSRQREYSVHGRDCEEVLQ